MENKELKNYKKEALEVCKDFGYPMEVVEAVKSASSIVKISNVMHDAKKFI